MKLTSPIVSTQWLADHLDLPGLRIFDTSVYLTVNPAGPGYITESGRSRWAAAHVPGAGFLEMLNDFSDNSSGVGFTMPPAARFAELAGEHGIGDDTTVVLYGGQSIMWSTRMWWMLRTIGFDNAAILDGGWEKWEREQRPTSSAFQPYPRAKLTPHPRPRMWADKTEVLQAMRDPAVCTINALAPDVYSGETNRYGRPGHIPGSHNVYYNSLLDPADGTYLPAGQLRERFDAAGAFTRPRVITYCGGGVTATMDALALTLLGHPDVSVYDGSMMEWVADPALPLTLGTEPG
jgi:thiosulfate/3-mercaptopyruvate sulfurtransferase